MRLGARDAGRASATGRITSDERIDRTTVWRALKRLGVPTRRVRSPKVRDCRRFAYPHRLDMVLCDGKHFRAGVGRRKRVALLFLDIDNFKAINDQHGHPVGDQVLIEFCQRIQRHLRRGECFGRWGGEEFMVLLPNADVEGARHFAERCRRRVAESRHRLAPVLVVAKRRPLFPGDLFTPVDKAATAAALS